jgi:hypothetical protein
MTTLRLMIVLALTLGAAPSLAQDQATDAGQATAAGEAAEEPQTAGDLDLYGTLEIFKDSASLESFEEKINSAEAEINNLDLNEDDEVDYVAVWEEVDGDVHVIILRALLGENEQQDVATIELEKKGEEVSVQAVGVPAIYGEDYIVEPAPEPESAALPADRQGIRIASADGGGLPSDATPPLDFWDEVGESAFDTAAVVVVSSWRVVRVVYAPGYRPWRSPYRWRHYPSRYRVRRPVARSHHRHRNAHYRNRNYRRTTNRHSTRASNAHSNRKSSSLNRASTRPASTSSRSPGSAAGAGTAGGKSNKATSAQPNRTSASPSRSNATKKSTTQQPSKSRASSPSGTQKRGTAGGAPRRGGGARRR